MKHVLLFAAALTIGSAAFAQGEYPPCSRSVQDHCMNDRSRERDVKHGMPAHEMGDGHMGDGHMGDGQMGGHDHGDHHGHGHHHRHHHKH